MNPVLHLVPRTHPVIDGIGDYALNLARHIRAQAGIPASFLIGDPAWEGPEQHDGFGLKKLPARTAGDLAAALETSRTKALVVHYVTYGYHPRGVPVWFRDGLDQWLKQQTEQPRVVTVFHELWSSGPPWRSEFYFGWMQRRLVRRMLRVSGRAVTSTLRMKRLLDAVRPGVTDLLPIPSNFPLGSSPPTRTPSAGGLRLILFGQTAQRLHSARAHLPLIRSLQQSGRLAVLHVVGKGAAEGTAVSEDVAFLRSAAPEVALRIAGNVALEEAVARFRGSDLFLSFYPASLACKSTALMSALACGCAAVLPDDADSAPLVVGQHFLSCDGSAASVERLLSALGHGGSERIGQAAAAWYRENADWPIIARRFAKLLGQP